MDQCSFCCIASRMFAPQCLFFSASLFSLLLSQVEEKGELTGVSSPARPGYLGNELYKQRMAIVPKRLQWCHLREYWSSQCRVNHWINGVWAGWLEGWLTAWMNGWLDNGWMDDGVMDGYGLIQGGYEDWCVWRRQCQVCPNMNLFRSKGFRCL